MEKIAFLGCSRGLGKEVVLAWDKETHGYGFSRKQENLEDLKKQVTWNLDIQSIDFSKTENLQELTSFLESQKLDRLFYFAAGGPYGNFTDKEWKDHQWALQVNFLTPAFLLHRLTKIKQMIFIGSTIADSRPDAKASSYAASKHALKGLVSSLIKEKDPRDIRLFRPSYMDTDLLPPQAQPRHRGDKILAPSEVAQIFVEWANDSSAEPILSLDS